MIAAACTCHAVEIDDPDMASINASDGLRGLIELMEIAPQDETLTPAWQAALLRMVLQNLMLMQKPLT
jgi:hypothetical protein